MESADLAGRIDTVEQRMDSMELHWDASFAALRTQILQSNCEMREAILATLRGEVVGEFSAMRTEVAGEFTAMRTEVAEKFSAIQTEVAGEFTAVRAEVAGEFSAMRSEVAREFTTMRAEVGREFSAMELRDYFERLLLEARKAAPFLKKPVLLVPVGHAMYALDLRMRAGEVSGYSDIHQLYKDGIHLNEAGSYLVGCTFFATLFGEDPAGLPTEPYGTIAPAVAKAIQQTVWDTVRQHPASGVR